MTIVGTILGCILIFQIVYSFCAALYVYHHVHGMKHTRYDGLHIYATIGQSDYHVPREVLELYMHIKDPRITKPKDGKKQPENPKVFLSWGFALLLPRVVGRAVRPFDDAP